eukprot:219439_1
MALLDTNEGHQDIANGAVKSDPDHIKLMEFIQQYKLHQIEQQLISEGITIDFLLGESENSIKEIAQELTAKSIQQKKFIYAVKKIKCNVVKSDEIQQKKKESIDSKEQTNEVRTADKWDENLKGSKLLLESDILTQTGDWNQTAFLTNIIGADTGMHEWKFKLTKFNGCNLSIGIFITDFDPTTSLNGFYHSTTSRSYSLHANNGRLWKHDAYDFKDGIYADPCKENDIISMRLDMNTLTLSFSMNHKDCGKAFDVKKATYKAVVNLYKRGTQIQLVSYNCFC